MEPGTAKPKTGCRKPLIILGILGVLLALVCAAAVLLLTFAPFQRIAYYPAEEAAPGSVEDMPTEAVSELGVESSPDTLVTADTLVAQYNLSYPLWMRPGSSDSVLFTVVIPAEMLALDVEEFTRQDILPQSVPAIGTLGSAEGSIYIDALIRVELDSQTFQVQQEYPAQQEVSLSANTPTYWAWSLRAPPDEGFHRINIKVYLDETSDLPSWFGTYQIEVLQPTPTPAPTATELIPTPTPGIARRIGDSLVDNFAEILITLIPTIIAALAALGGFVVKPIRRIRSIRELESRLASEVSEDEIDRISLQIQELSAIRWWQFWK